MTPDERLDRIERAIENQNTLFSILTMEILEMADLTKLNASVAHTAELITEVSAAVDRLAAAVAAANAGGDQAAIDAAQAAVDANNAALEAIANANPA